MNDKKKLNSLGKKFPMIHSNTMAKIKSTGPTKKKMPTTGANPSLPPQPISTMEKVKVEMTKPTKPSAVGFANRWL
jgi:hypothetical protein